MLQVPSVISDFFLLRQFEEGMNGKIVDTSAFNTMDFIKGFQGWEFDKYRYFTDKVAERAADLAIMHSCISSPEGREMVKAKFVALVNARFRNYALRLAAMANATQDKDRKAEIRQKIRERNRQIARLRAIWHSHAYRD